MNIFLDTHVLLWWLDDSQLLSDKVRNAIANSENLVVLSSVVIWEIRIKQALGKLIIAPEFYDVIKDEGFEMLSITPDHAYAVGELPMYHRDPFDRMIIAQAKLEGLTIATQDSVFKKYEVPVLDV
jgi:PIN domain nuclease of toxin-antitoxin system